MKEGPDITRIGAMLGDPTRANMLVALMGGKALTAGELAFEAGVTAATASGHLRQLSQAGLIAIRQQGRHRYATLAGDEVGHALETLLGLAAANGHLRSRTGPRDPGLRAARVCYDHLAGAAGVQAFDSLVARGFLELGPDALALTAPGRAWAQGFGLDLARLEAARRPLCRSCLDWSERRSHLAGGLGAAILSRLFETGWARRGDSGRAVTFTATGRALFDTAFAPGARS
ncbi:MAG: helix-turn-helix transcriptional regulator [Paracoccaceae bacterium]